MVTKSFMRHAQFFGRIATTRRALVLISKNMSIGWRAARATIAAQRRRKPWGEPANH